MEFGDPLTSYMVIDGERDDLGRASFTLYWFNDHPRAQCFRAVPEDYIKRGARLVDSEATAIKLAWSDTEILTSLGVDWKLAVRVLARVPMRELMTYDRGQLYACGMTRRRAEILYRAFHRGPVAAGSTTHACATCGDIACEDHP